MTSNLNIQLEGEQLTAYEDIQEFAASDRASAYVLHGLAGTGKTTVLAKAAQDFHFPICAPTAKAAHVLRRKSGLYTCTVHQMFLRLVDEQDDPMRGHRLKRRRTTSAGESHPVFTRDLADEDKKLEFETIDPADVPKIVMVDECSMVGSRLAKNILDSGARIIAVGDPGQLPPVDDIQHFTKPSFKLDQIRRQAADSPIIRQAHRVRYGHPYQTDGEGFQVIEKMPKEEFLQAGAVIVFKRATRDKLTDMLRGFHSVRDQCPQAGEPIICLKNCYQHNLHNGMTGRLIEPFEPGDHVIHFMSDEGVEYTVPEVEFNGMPYAVDYDVPVTKFDFAYALTCHKAQGSEWDTVIVIDEMPQSNPDRRAWLYTAVTRAAKRCIVMPL